MRFAVPPAWDRARRASHEGFKCPNGHELVYLQKSAVDELNDKIAELEKTIEALNKELTMLKRPRDLLARFIP